MFGKAEKCAQRPFRDGGRLVPLTQGQFAIVDEQDYPAVMAWDWSFHDGYATGAKSVRMHRFILDAPCDKQVDHINGNPLDNRRSNLRLCSHRENTLNRKVYKSAQFKGIRLRPSGRYEVRVMNKHIGMFDSLAAAMAEYNSAAKQVHGEFAWQYDMAAA